MIFGREPVAWMALVNACVALGAVLWPERLEPSVQAGIIAVATAVTALIARSQVTPVK